MHDGHAHVVYGAFLATMMYPDIVKEELYMRILHVKKNAPLKEQC